MYMHFSLPLHPRLSACFTALVPFIGFLALIVPFIGFLALALKSLAGRR
ncbi:hypothetical protein LTSEMON_4964 [Salmonella enterica subsp. enterica serovar Montevideo str. S5-403]|uniref:Uncharacterized protein n=1 Tax=Salmonella enterica subsp. enterica serovar Montevideo str. S5-403 TaxID=913242 RepID=G5Q965_SALMO|nr:hypothetical protein LTSEMON_4964 [Salmonella enterica subsp. enterica serovar Montevideo str. S5-403]